ncbi:MAG: DUF177 domain-containing protein [Desulfobacterales bacterium]|nr:DUF177 domain-containing protein [Desulfobacterales bacterium]
MIIDLKAISDGPRHFDFAREPDWWQGDEYNDQILGLDDTLKSRLTIYKTGSKHILDGSISGGIRMKCARCLESYHRDLEYEFSLFLAPFPEDSDRNEIELSEDDMAIDFITGYEIDLDAIIREQVYLSIPMQPLCREDCAGLCHICGANLNSNRCECPQEMGHPGFSKLKNLKFQRL